MRPFLEFFAAIKISVIQRFFSGRQTLRVNFCNSVEEKFHLINLLGDGQAPA